VARLALAALPLSFVLVAAEALAHWRQGSALPHDARVARYALTANFWQRQVQVVANRNFTERAGRFQLQYRQHLRAIPLVTRLAQSRLRQLELAVGLRRRVTRVAAEAGWLPWLATSKPGQVLAVRKTRHAGGTPAGSQHGRHQHAQTEQRGVGAAQAGVLVSHRALRDADRSKS
jgi:hypothetical protein